MKNTEAFNALKLAEAKNLHGKIITDVSNPLDFSHGMPPCLLPVWLRIWGATQNGAFNLKVVR